MGRSDQRKRFGPPYKGGQSEACPPKAATSVGTARESAPLPTLQDRRGAVAPFRGADGVM
jgi:hypothetical protein